jgi:hypothetical protein
MFIISYISTMPLIIHVFRYSLYFYPLYFPFQIDHFLNFFHMYSNCYISAGQSNITLRSSSWRMKFIHHSKFPLPTKFIETALNFSFIKMSDRNLKFVYLFCQTSTFLFLLNRTSPSFSYRPFHS